MPSCRTPSRASLPHCQGLEAYVGPELSGLQLAAFGLSVVAGTILLTWLVVEWPFWKSKESDHG